MDDVLAGILYLGSDVFQSTRIMNYWAIHCVKLVNKWALTFRGQRMWKGQGWLRRRLKGRHAGEYWKGRKSGMASGRKEYFLRILYICSSWKKMSFSNFYISIKNHRMLRRLSRFDQMFQNLHFSKTFSQPQLANFIFWTQKFSFVHPLRLHWTNLQLYPNMFLNFWLSKALLISFQQLNIYLPFVSRKLPNHQKSLRSVWKLYMCIPPPFRRFFIFWLGLLGLLKHSGINGIQKWAECKHDVQKRCYNYSKMPDYLCLPTTLFHICVVYHKDLHSIQLINFTYDQYLLRSCSKSTSWFLDQGY